MIKSNELRIGNWLTKDEASLQVGSIEFTGFHYIYSSSGLMHQLETLEPIPLTPEILEKTGFEAQKGDTDNILKFTIGENPVTHDYMMIITHFKNDNIFFYRNGYHQIKYLHQLQNLYFALTGEELNIDFP